MKIQSDYECKAFFCSNAKKIMNEMLISAPVREKNEEKWNKKVRNKNLGERKE